MMTLDEVTAFVSALPDVVVGTKWGKRTWMVGESGFAWQRPFSKTDLTRFGDERPPTGDILAVIVENLDAKEALLEIAPPGFFTIPHFQGFPAILIELRVARKRDVRAALTAAWRIATAKATATKRPRANRTRVRSKRR